MNTIEIGDKVIVNPTDEDTFQHEWCGRVSGFERGFVQVTDQTNNVFDCIPSQLTSE